MSKASVIGIDLKTTYSGVGDIIPNNMGERTRSN